MTFRLHTPIISGNGCRSLLQDWQLHCKLMQDNMPGGGGIEGVLSIPALMGSMAYSKATSGSAEAKR